MYSESFLILKTILPSPPHLVFDIVGLLAQSAKKVEHFFRIFPNVKIPNWRSQRVEYFWYSSWPLKMLGSGCGGLERGQKVQKKNPKFLFLSHGKWIVQNDASALEIIFDIGGDPPKCIIFDLMDLLDPIAKTVKLFCLKKWDIKSPAWPLSDGQLFCYSGRRVNMPCCYFTHM